MEVTLKDRGKYKCIAKNKFGKATTMCELFVEGMLLLYTIHKNLPFEFVLQCGFLYDIYDVFFLCFMF